MANFIKVDEDTWINVDYIASFKIVVKRIDHNYTQPLTFYEIQALYSGQKDYVSFLSEREFASQKTAEQVIDKILNGSYEF